MAEAGRDHDVVALGRADAVDDVDAEGRVRLLVVVVGLELDRHSGQHVVRDGPRPLPTRGELAGDAVEVTVVLVQHDAGEAVHVRAVRRQDGAVVEGDRQRVVELPRVVTVGKDVEVDLGELELLDGDRPGAQHQRHGGGRLVVEVAIVGVDRLAEEGVLAEPVAVVVREGPEVGLGGGGSPGGGGVTRPVLDEDVQHGVVVEVVVLGVEVDGDLLDDRAGVQAEVGEHEGRRLERAVAVAERRPDAGVAEADDVGPAVAGEVGEEARMAARRASPGRSRSRRATSLRAERAVAVVDSDPDAGVAEADDVGAPVAGDVGDEARVACRRASPGRSRSRRADRRRRRRCRRRCSARRPDAGVAEADDVGAPSPVRSASKPRVLVDPPALVGTEVGEHELRRSGTCRHRCSSATQTPASPKPTMSALPSPVRSATKRGCLSTRQPWL